MRLYWQECQEIYHQDGLWNVPITLALSELLLKNLPHEDIDVRRCAILPHGANMFDIGSLAWCESEGGVATKQWVA